MIFGFTELVIVDVNIEVGIAVKATSSSDRQFVGTRHTFNPSAGITAIFCVRNGKPTNITIFFPSLCDSNGCIVRRLRDDSNGADVEGQTIPTMDQLQ